ncbi:MAG TPA: hypothetical protein IAB39_01750 [Candidatus Onthovicinus excrementipullorum]|nr:hypothetical protein [Candidatus Onthovicinus excrementipullorum]
MLDPYIRQYGRRLYGLCLALCANADDADDLYQDTWLKALQHFSHYDAERPFEPWLTKICVHKNSARAVTPCGVCLLQPPFTFRRPQTDCGRAWHKRRPLRAAPHACPVREPARRPS